MKKLLLSLFIMSAAGTYAQEIRMPEEKRKEYVKEQEAQKLSSAKESGQTVEERKRRALEERKKAAMMKSALNSNRKIYCIIQEQRNMGENDVHVKVVTDKDFELSIKEAGPTHASVIGVALQKQKYTSALQALNNFSKNGWELISTNVYSEKSLITHEYLVGVSLK